MTKKDEIINKIVNMLYSDIDLDNFKEQLYLLFYNYEISDKCTDLVAQNQDIDTKAIQNFFVTKKVEGASDKTLTYYSYVIRKFLSKVSKSIVDITKDDIKYYIAYRSMNDNISKCTQDNELRVLKSFFAWLTAEDFIPKNPALNIKAIKQDQIIKTAFTEIELEKLRRSCKSKRDLALVDFLYSTGARVSEVEGCDISSIDNDEVKVFGKGNKERIVFLNAKAKLTLSEYLNERTDTNPALFISDRKPFNRLSKSSIEKIIRQIGADAGVDNVHPHRFRRSCATVALNRGMPLEQVQQMLGHSKITTTTIYAKSAKENVKESHRRYVI